LKEERERERIKEKKRKERSINAKLNHHRWHALYYQEEDTTTLPITWWKGVFGCRKALHELHEGYRCPPHAPECATWAPIFFFSQIQNFPWANCIIIYIKKTIVKNLKHLLTLSLIFFTLNVFLLCYYAF